MTIDKIFVATVLTTLCALAGCSGSDEQDASGPSENNSDPTEINDANNEPQGPHICTETSCGENEACVVVSQSVCGVLCGGVSDPGEICGENFSCTSSDGEDPTCTPSPPNQPECNDYYECLEACLGETEDTDLCVNNCKATHINDTAIGDAVTAWLACGEEQNCNMDFDCMEFQCSAELVALETACQMPGDWCEDPKACAQICDRTSADAAQCPEGTECAESGHCL